MKAFLEKARRLIRIQSVSPQGNEEVANYVLALMQDRGLKTQLQQVTHSTEKISKRQFNVVGILGDVLADRKVRKGLLLGAHLDTVAPGLLEHWTMTGGDPFAATLRDGKIYGLGAADAKLDFLCKLFATESFRERKLKQPIYLLGSCGEELGMMGTKYFIKASALNPKYVLVGEPSDLKMIVAHKRLVIYKVSIGYQQVERDTRGFNRRIELQAFGKSAHGAFPQLGKNAILTSVDFLHRAANRGFEMRFTRLEGGDRMNVVPDRAVTQFYLTSHQFEDFKRFFRDNIRAEGKERMFRVDLGGAGDIGVRFLPDQLFACLNAVVCFFQDFAFGLASTQDAQYEQNVSTVNLRQVLQSPGLMEIFVDLRLLPGLDPEAIHQNIVQGILKIAKQFPQLNLNVLCERRNPVLNMPMEDSFVGMVGEAMKAAGIEPEYVTNSTSTEAAHYFQAGYPALAFGPGHPIGNSHCPNEYNTLEQIEKAILFYQKIIEKVCL